jgi:hypothetical protein
MDLVLENGVIGFASIPIGEVGANEDHDRGAASHL